MAELLSAHIFIGIFSWIKNNQALPKLSAIGLSARMKSHNPTPTNANTDPVANADAHRLRQALAEDYVRALETATREAQDRGEAPDSSVGVARVHAWFGRFEEARAILDSVGITRETPPSILAHLERGAAGEVPETPKPGEAIFDGVEHRVVASL